MGHRQMKVESLVSFSYKDDKTISWRYENNIVSLGTFSHQEPSTDIMRVDCFTRRGRCYGLDKKKKQDDLRF